MGANRSHVVALSLATVVLATLSTGSVAAPAAAPEREARGPAKPNIVFILADDLDFREISVMPRLHELVAEAGTSFESYFVTDSLCCPSRSSIQRGQFVHDHGVLGNKAPNGGFQRFHQLRDDASTIGTWLQAAGYKTALYGKYLNGYPKTAGLSYLPPGWDDWVSPVNDSGYQEYDYTLNDNGSVTQHGHTPAEYLTDVLAERAKGFITRQAAAGRPFFAYVAVYAPHQPATPAPRHADLFPGARAPRTPSYDEADVSDKPEFIRSLGPIRPRAQERIDQLYRKRLQSLQAVDDLIATVVDALKAAGQLDRTYLVFTSDNGFHLGQHRMHMGKQTAYEEDIHVPLIVRGPGVAPGRTESRLALEIDLAPTFAEWAGAAAPSFVDGRSLAPLLAGRSPGTWRQAVLVEHYSSATEPFASEFEESQKNRAAIPTYKALRTADTLYVEYVTGERELYDLKRDPAELDNALAPGGHADPGQVKKLADWLHRLGSCAAASCRSAEEE